MNLAESKKVETRTYLLLNFTLKDCPAPNYEIKKHTYPNGGVTLKSYNFDSGFDVKYLQVLLTKEQGRKMPEIYVANFQIFTVFAIGKLSGFDTKFVRF